MNQNFESRYEEIIAKAQSMIDAGEEFEVRVSHNAWVAARDGKLAETFPEPTLESLIASLIMDEKRADDDKGLNLVYASERLAEIQESIETLPRPVPISIKSPVVEPIIQTETKTSAKRLTANTGTIPNLVPRIIIEDEQRRPEPPRRLVQLRKVNS